MKWMLPIAVAAVSVVAMSVVLAVVPAAVEQILPWAFRRIPSEGTQHP